MRQFWLLQQRTSPPLPKADDIRELLDRLQRVRVTLHLARRWGSASTSTPSRVAALHFDPDKIRN